VSEQLCFGLSLCISSEAWVICGMWCMDMDSGPDQRLYKRHEKDQDFYVNVITPRLNEGYMCSCVHLP